MSNLRTVVVGLVAVNIATALGVVYSKHNSRMLFKQTRVLSSAIDRANVCLLYTSPSPRDRG